MKELNDDLPVFEKIRPIVAHKKKVVVARPLEEIEKAVWQYIIDHSKPCKEGYAVTFLAKNKQDFFRRVEARRTGVFKREDQSKIERNVKKIKRTSDWVQKRTDAYTNAQKTGTWWLKLAIKLRKKLTVFIDYHSMKLQNLPLNK